MIEPTDKIGRITLYNADCMEVMKQFKDKEFDLAIVDPPYGIGADLKNSKRELKSKKSATLSHDFGNQVWDNETPKEDYFDELKRSESTLPKSPSNSTNGYSKIMLKRATQF